MRKIVTGDPVKFPWQMKQIDHYETLGYKTLWRFSIKGGAYIFVYIKN